MPLIIKEKLSILVIDDDEDDIFITSEYLKGISHFEINITHETNYKKAEQAIAGDGHDIYFIDYLLGPHTGIDLINAAIARGNKKPFILLTGKGYHTIDMEATKSGAYDYLIKSEINSEQLERSIRYSLERYKAYISLLESETRYREIFSRSKDIIFLADTNAQFIDFNDAMSILLGYTRDELLKMSMIDLYDSLAERDKIFSVLNEKNEIKDVEILLKAKNGEKKYFIASGIKLKDKNGNPLYQGLLHDYTFRKNLEKENVLNEKVGAISRLVRSLAHEIRNPLTNINLAMEQLDAELNQENKLFSDIVLRNSERINNIITELANLSRAEDFNQGMQDIREVLDRTIEKAKDRLELKGIKLTRNYPQEAVMVNVDMEKIQIAFLNLIINAIEASEKFKGHVEIMIKRNEDYASILICDNGCGMSADIIPSLFEPYFTRKKNGLGRALQQRIVL